MPIVVATIPVTQGLPGAERIIDIVFVLVVVYTLIQAPTLPRLGRRLGVVESGQALDVEVEIAPLEQLRADLLQVRVGAGSRLHGVYVEELRLPVGAHVTLIVRGDQSLVPGRHTHFVHGDQLLVVATTEVREQTEARLRAVARGGKLARWNGETGRLTSGGDGNDPRYRAVGTDESYHRQLGALTMFFRRTSTPVTEADALPGRDREIPVAARHAVLGTSMTPPWPERAEGALCRHGLLLGRRAHLLGDPRRAHDRRRLHRRLHAEPDV